jgi:leucine dehydrogenase
LRQSGCPDDIYGVEADVFAPCALGAVINDETVGKLRCAVIAGSANNQFLEVRHGDLLRERNILYAPDYVINAGGLITFSLVLSPKAIRSTAPLN